MHWCSTDPDDQFIADVQLSQEARNAALNVSAIAVPACTWFQSDFWDQKVQRVQ